MSEIPSSLSRWEPSRWLKASFLVAAALAVLLLLGGKIWQHTVADRHRLESAAGAMQVEGLAHPFTLEDHAGRPVSLESFRGKVVFLNFWATWCGPCREEMPSLADLARKTDASDAVFLAVSVDPQWSVVDEFLGKQPQPFTVLLDKDEKVARAYGTEKYPETWLIDREGRLVYKFEGMREWDTMAAQRILERVGARRIPGA